MCGRYTFFNNFDSLIESFNIDEIDSNIIESKPNYNISPTQYAPVIFQNDKKRIVKNMRWGLIPSWAKDDFKSLHNARLEGIETKISFKKLIKISSPEKHKKTIFIWPEGIFYESNLKYIKNYESLFSNEFSENHLIALGINNFKEQKYAC